MYHNTKEQMLLTTNELVQVLRTTREALWRWRKSGLFPEPLRMHRRLIRWRSADIAKWLGISEEELLHELQQLYKQQNTASCDG